MNGQILSAVGDVVVVALDKRLDASNIGERRQHRDLDSLKILLVQPEGELLHEGDCLKVVDVHLPVASHQRLALGHSFSSVLSMSVFAAVRTANPGSSLPSRNSRLAPPPVLM